MVDSKHIRRPGWLERYYIIRNTYRYYTNFNITVKLDKPITANLLSNGLRGLLEKNPWYIINFFKDDAANYKYMNALNYHARYVDEIKFEDVVEFHNIEEFDGSIMSKMNDYQLPINCATHGLWKIHVYTDKNQDQYILIMFDHSMFDGGSGIIFQQELISELANAQDTKVDVLYKYHSDLPPIPLEAQSNTDMYNPTLYQKITYFVNKYFPKILINLYNKLFVPKPKANLGINPLYSNSNHDWKHNNMKTSITNINFNTEETADILKYCRSQGITMAPYLNVLMLQCLQETILYHPQIQYSSETLIAFQGRRYSPDLNPQYLKGVWVSAQSIILPPITNTVETMKYVYQEMQNNLRSKFSFGQFGLFRYFENRSFFEASTILPIKKTLTVSNLGKIPDTNDKYNIIDAYFGLSVGSNYNVVLNMISTTKGGLNVTIGYFPDFDQVMINDKKAIDICFDRFKARVLQKF